MSNVTIGTIHIVTNDMNRKRPWTPSTKEVGGYTFIKLQKWCRDWTRFVKGTCLNLKQSATSSIASKYWDALLQERDQASVAALKEVVVDPDDPESQKAWKKRKVSMSDANIAPNIVSLQLPMVEGHDVFGAGAEIRALWAVRSPDLWIELCATSLDHIRAGILASEPVQPRPKRARKAVSDREKSACE